MSDIRVNTISAADGVSPVTLTKQIAAKVWARYDGSSVISDSFNVSSTTDGTIAGETTISYTSSMSDANYATQATCNGTSGDRWVTVSNQTGGECKAWAWDASGITRTDLPVGLICTGDLA